MKSIREYLAAALLSAALFAGPGKAEEPKEPKPQAQEKISVSNFGLNTTQYTTNGGPEAETAIYTVLSKGKKEGWFVYGQHYDELHGLNSADAGLKFCTNKEKGNFYRATFATNRSKDGNQYQSVGLDWEQQLFSADDNSFYILGDVSSVGGERRHTDYGIGGNLVLSKDHNIFALRSGRDGKAGYKTGYMFFDKDRLFALHADTLEGRKPSFTGWASFPDKRFFMSYDAESRDFSTGSLISFGNKPLPKYAMTDLLKEQYILTSRSVVDSDYSYIFPAMAFVNPKKKMADVFRLNFTYNARQKSFTNVWLNNALMFGRHIILTQNAERIGGKNYFGGGFGYRIGPYEKGVTPAVRFQKSGGSSVVAFEAFFSY